MNKHTKSVVFNMLLGYSLLFLSVGIATLSIIFRVEWELNNAILVERIFAQSVIFGFSIAVICKSMEEIKHGDFRFRKQTRV